MELNKSDYKIFFEEIKERIRLSQYTALKKVNKELIKLYWYIGQTIVEKQKEHGWKKSVVEHLSKDLQMEYPGSQGYSSRNLWNMRRFYLEYHDNEKLQPLVAEIGWSHNTIILEKCKEDLQREYYIKMTKKFGWTKSVLIHQIEGKNYESFLLSQTNFDQTLVDKYKDQAVLAVKDEYSFDFLEMSEQYRERDLELGLVKDISGF